MALTQQTRLIQNHKTGARPRAPRPSGLARQRRARREAKPRCVGVYPLTDKRGCFAKATSGGRILPIPYLRCIQFDASTGFATTTTGSARDRASRRDSGLNVTTWRAAKA